MRSPRQLWLPSAHPLLAAERVTLADIAPYPYILATVDEGETSTLRYWHAAGLAPNVVFKTSSMESLRGLVAHGFGVTILSDMLYRGWSLEGRKLEARPVADGRVSSRTATRPCSRSRNCRHGWPASHP